MFQKGQSGNPGGKPKGTKNKNFLSLQYWFGLIADNAEDLTPKEQIEIAFKAANLLVPKITTLPMEPGDSVDNAKKTLELLQELENKPKVEESASNS